jgi:tRNA threonylcarbamoyladenosine biosynthesis protein TsaB
MPASGSRLISLALDSAGGVCSAVVAIGDKILAGERTERSHGQAEALMPIIDAVMSKAGFSPAELNIVAASVGPGSFTGLRVGLAAARGIVLATGARLIGVTSFEAAAAGVVWPAGGHPRFLLVALESRREDIYVQLFSRRGALGQPAAVMPEALLETVNLIVGEAPLLIAGDAAQRAASALSNRAAAIRLEGSAPEAAGVLRAGLRRRHGGRSVAPRPLYLRPPGVTLSGSKPC